MEDDVNEYVVYLPNATVKRLERKYGRNDIIGKPAWWEITLMKLCKNHPDQKFVLVFEGIDEASLSVQKWVNRMEMRWKNGFYGFPDNVTLLITNTDERIDYRKNNEREERER